MLDARHGAGPADEVFADIRLDTPNLSARMDNLRAALLRPQLRTIEADIAAWNARHDRIASTLSEHQAIRMPVRPPPEAYAGSSIQFRIPVLGQGGCEALVAALAAVGVEVKWFGAPAPVGFTSDHRSWRYVEAQHLPRTDAVLASLFDMRLPLTFSLDDCDWIAGHIRREVSAVTGETSR
jgi:dTDP-4-amino-4,6-dideoxygalactose transaminase